MKKNFPGNRWLLTVLSLAIVFIFSACAAQSPLPAEEGTPTPTLAPTATPTPENTPTPRLIIAPEVKAVLDAQKAPYTVDASGKAVIDLKDTTAKEQIVLEQIGHIPTNFGLAEDILSGYDKDNFRYVFVENYGWVKDIDTGSPENLTKILSEYGESGVINTLAALHYQKNPTIPKNAIDPEWWLRGIGSKESGGYAAYLGFIPVQNDKEIRFTRSTKPFGSPPTFWLEFEKDRKSFVTVVWPVKNPNPDNKDQLINLNLTFDKDYFDVELARYLDNLKKNKTKHDNIVDYLINDRTAFRVIIAADQSRPTIHDKFPHLAGPDGVMSVGALQKQGELLNLFPPEIQDFIKREWEKESQVAWGDIPFNEIEINLNEVPKEFALKFLAADTDSFPWGDIQP